MDPIVCEGKATPLAELTQYEDETRVNSAKGVAPSCVHVQIHECIQGILKHYQGKNKVFILFFGVGRWYSVQTPIHQFRGAR